MRCEGLDIDVVHICTPNHLHFALAEAAKLRPAST
jgi:predicted dehydrogenase